jgi:inhibitor of KinA sporulation pathway (predicted exonuclease)
MATTVKEEKELVLIDGTKIKIRPLKISLLKSFMAKFEGIQTATSDNQQAISVLMECVQIAMKQYKPELAEDLAALEELMDLPTVYQIVEEASGVRLTDSLIS